MKECWLSVKASLFLSLQHLSCHGMQQRVLSTVLQGRRGITSLTIPAREINNQVSLLPLPFSILGLIKNSSVTTLQLSRSERLLENLCFSLAGPGIKKKKKIPRLNLIFMLSSR